MTKNNNSSEIARLAIELHTDKVVTRLRALYSHAYQNMTSNPSLDSDGPHDHEMRHNTACDTMAALEKAIEIIFDTK